MRPWLHFHPDRILYVRDEDQDDIAVATFDEKSKQVAAFPLPEGVAQIEYHEGVAFCYDKRGNQLDQRPDPSVYEAILKQLTP